MGVNIIELAALRAQDVTNRLDLTPVAIMEGMAFAMTVFGDKPMPCIHEKVTYMPTVDFTLALAGKQHALHYCRDPVCRH